jgi:hypothetical protein
MPAAGVHYDRGDPADVWRREAAVRGLGEAVNGRFADAALVAEPPGREAGGGEEFFESEVVHKTQEELTGITGWKGMVRFQIFVLIRGSCFSRVRETTN